MDPNLPVPSKIGQKSEMCLNSSLFHCPKCPKLDLFEYSKQKHTFSHSVRTSTLSCFDLGIIYSFRTYSKRTFTNKKKYLAVALSWSLAANTLNVHFRGTVYFHLAWAISVTGETYRQSSYSKSFNVVLFMWLHVSKQ